MRRRLACGLAPLACAALIAGCAPALAPVPGASAVAPPVAWRTEMQMHGDIDSQWWNAFGDPAIARLVAAAQINNPDIAIASARVREARGQERAARSALHPTLDVAAPFSESRSMTPFGAASQSLGAQPVFQAAYEVDLFGRNEARVDAANADTASAQAAREATMLAVTSAAVTGYITLLTLDRRLETLRDTLGSRGEALKIARDRAEAGYTSQLELRQAEAEFRAAQQQIPAVQAAITRQENAISLLIGESPRSIARSGTFARLQAPAIPAVLPSELMRRRPDIAQAEYALAASDARMRSARAQFLPQIRLAASAGAVLSSRLDDPVGIWSLGGSVLAPLFSGGRLEGQFEAATAQRDQAAFAYKRTVLTALREAEDQLALIHRLSQQESELQAQREAVADALRHATNRYRAGYSPYLEQIDAQRALLSVDLAILQVQSDRLNAHVALYQALGGAPDETP